METEQEEKKIERMATEKSEWEQVSRRMTGGREVIEAGMNGK